MIQRIGFNDEGAGGPPDDGATLVRRPAKKPALYSVSMVGGVWGGDYSLAVKGEVLVEATSVAEARRMARAVIQERNVAKSWVPEDGLEMALRIVATRVPEIAPDATDDDGEAA